MLRQLSWLLALFFSMGVLVFPCQYYLVDNYFTSASRTMLAEDLDMRGRPNFYDLSPSFCRFFTTSVLLVRNLGALDLAFEFSV